MWIFYVTRSVVGRYGNDLHGQTDHSQNRLRSHGFHLPFCWICALFAALVIVCDADNLGHQTEDSDNALRRHADSPAFPAVIRNACPSMYVSPLPVPFPEDLERLIGKAADKADDRADSTADGCACRRTDLRAEERADRSENRTAYRTDTGNDRAAHSRTGCAVGHASCKFIHASCLPSFGFSERVSSCRSCR